MTEIGNLLHDCYHDLARISIHVEFIKDNPEKLEKSLEQIKISTKDLSNKLDSYYNNNKNNNVELLLEELENYTEWMETTEGDEIECISIENLKGILKKYKVKLIK